MTRRFLQRFSRLGRRWNERRRNAESTRRRRRRVPLGVERLEGRRLLSGATPVFGEPRLISASADGARGLFSADLDGDADLDVLWGSVGGDTVLWSENDGRGGFGPERVVAGGLDQVNSVLATDMDGDGDVDVVAAASRGWSAPVVWYENQGGGSSFTQHPIATTAWGTVSVVVADVDRDGDPDVITATLYAGNGLVWHENTSGGQAFIAHALPASYAEAHDVFVADLDSDGDPDVLAAFAAGNTVAWYENDGHQVFTEHPISNSAVSARSVVAVDLDRDGDLDPLSASYGDDKIAWYANDGKQNFIEHPISTSIDGAYDIVPADLDGDGDWDLVSTGCDGNTIAWHENEGEQNFALHVVSQDVPAVWSVLAADLDGDGDSDLLSASGNEGANNSRVAWYENQPALVADAGGPYSGEEGIPIAFDASNSSCVGGGALQYRWDFDSDGQWDTEYSSGPNATYTWDDDHTGVVTVEVTDGLYAASAAAAITVHNVAPRLAGQVLLDEQFPSDPMTRDWFTTDPSTVRWDADGFLRANVNDVTGQSHFAYSPVFPGVENASFVLEFDVSPTTTDWGTYAQVHLIRHGVANPYVDNALRIGSVWDDGLYNGFQIGTGERGIGPDYSDSPQFTLGTWYRHRVNYDAATGELTWRITVGESEALFHQVTCNVGTLDAFDQIAVGYQAVPPQYGQGWTEICVDNLRLSTSVSSGLQVTPTEIDEGGQVTLRGAFLEQGMLDTHTVTIDWGDGVITTHPLAAGERAFSIPHVYADDDPSGTGADRYVIGVKITDDDGGQATDTVTVNVTDAVPVEIFVDDYTLLPNRRNQEVTIWVVGLTEVTGLNLRAQLGDGTGLLAEPVFSGVEFGGGIWDAYPHTVVGGPVNGLEQFLQTSVAFNEIGRNVPANGVIVRLLVDTTGFDEGQFDLRLAGTQIGADTVFVLAGGVELPVSIRNGSITIAAAEVAGAHVFYNGSSFDNRDSAANAGDDRAIAIDKVPLRPGEKATFENYTSYLHGINGIMVDIARLPATVLDAASFEFRVGNTQNTSGWLSGPVPRSISVRRGAGAGGSDRVTLIWPDGAIVGCWLQVTILATAETGLDSPYVFYFGNAPGESGNSQTNAFVDITDFVRVRDNPRDFLNRATTDCPFDFNRDSFVDGTDLAVVRDHATNFVTALILLDLRGGVKASRALVSGSPGFKPVSAPVAPASKADQVEPEPDPAAASLGPLPESLPSFAGPFHPCDVDRDGRVTSDDAMAVIKFIAAPAVATESHPEYDVNGDHSCTPLDALLVINCLTAGAEQAAEGEGGVEAGAVGVNNTTVTPAIAFQRSHSGPTQPLSRPSDEAPAATDSWVCEPDYLDQELDGIVQGLTNDLAHAWTATR